MCAKLAPKTPSTDNHGTRLKLRLAPPSAWTAETAAAELMKSMKPDPMWVAAWTSDLVVDFVVVWGDRHPLRQKLKENLHGWLNMDKETVKAAFKSVGVGAWRFDAIASLQLLQQQGPDRLSVSHVLTDRLLQQLQVELKGLPSWGERDKDMAAKAQDLMRRHVYGSENLSTRALADSYFQADLLKRKGPENFVKDMQERVRLSQLDGQTLVSLCAAAGAAARSYQHVSELNGSGWQLHLMSAFAKPEHQVRGVLVLGLPRCGKSHVGHQLYAGLPQGAVVKVQEAEQADIYTFGTKLEQGTVLLQIDEFEAKTSIAKLKNLLEPRSVGFEVRSGSSKGSKTHTTLPPNLQILITSNWNRDEVVAAYRRQGGH